MKNFFTLFLVLAIVFSTHAQVRNRRNVALGFGIQVAQPLGEFSQVYDGYPAGVQGYLSIPMNNSPFEMGIAAAWNSMGMQSESVSVFIGQDWQGDDIYEMGDLNINSNVTRYHAFARIRPFNGGFQIYADGLVGAQAFTTRTRVSLDESTSGVVAEEENVEMRDVTLQYGWAGGVRIRVAPTVFVEGRFEHLRGGVAAYADPSSIVVDEQSGNLLFETLESTTDSYTYQLGITFQF
jgi:hypothetical protein